MGQTIETWNLRKHFACTWIIWTSFFSIKVTNGFEWSFGSLSIISIFRQSLHQGRIFFLKTSSITGPSMDSCSKCRFTTRSPSLSRDLHLFFTYFEWNCMRSLKPKGSKPLIEFVYFCMKSISTMGILMICRPPKKTCFWAVYKSSKSPLLRLISCKHIQTQ